MLCSGSVLRYRLLAGEVRKVIELVHRPQLLAPGEVFGAREHESVCEVVAPAIVIALDVRVLRRMVREDLGFSGRVVEALPKLSDALSGANDIALIKRRERFTTVYMVEQDGQIEALILPVRGYGLWSTLHGFVALKSDLNTVVGLGFYQHAETPGLGGEVDNPKWKALWPGKTLFDDAGKPIIEIVKGGVDPSSAQAGHQVDALAGATLTSNGVDHLLQFWLGEQGFGPYLAKLRTQGV